MFTRSDRSTAGFPALSDNTTGRRSDISWLRILAVLLLFPYHTARVFDPGEQFYVHSEKGSGALSYFMTYLEPWHMPLLFLLAGAATWFALTRRSGGRYAGERFKRLLIPFAFGVLVLVPPQSYLGLLSHGGDTPGYFQWLPSFFQLNGDDMDGYYMGGHTWGHLWFIFHLFCYALVALPALLFLRRKTGARVRDVLARAAALPGVILLFALALVPARFVPEVAGGNPAFYLAIFLLGYIVVSDTRFEAAIDRHRLAALVLGPLACLVTTWFEVAGWPALPGWAETPLELYLGVFMPWFFMVALLGYGRRVFGASGWLASRNACRSGGWADRFVRYADEASYPAYLLHQTVIVAVAFLFVRLGLATSVTFTAILVAAFLVTILTYELVIRRAGVTRFLFGMKPLRDGAAAPAASAAPVPLTTESAASAHASAVHFAASTGEMPVTSSPSAAATTASFSGSAMQLNSTTTVR